VTQRVDAAAALTPYLAVGDARHAIAWYQQAFGASVAYDPIVMPDDRIGHAELTVFGGRLFLSDAHPEIGVDAPRPGAPAACTIHAAVPAVDDVFSHACDGGAIPEREPETTPHGRIAVIRDPFGHRWMLNQDGPLA
jgi:PhnB protein